MDPAPAATGPVCLLAEGLAGAAPEVKVPAVLVGPGREGERGASLIPSARILALGQEALDAAQAAGAPRLPLPGLWLCPAPLDAHVHLHLGGTVERNLARSRAAGLAAVRDLGHPPAKPTPRSPADGGPPWVVSSGPGLGAGGDGSSWLAEKLSGPEAFCLAAEARARAGAGVVKVFATGLLDFAQAGRVEHEEAVGLAELTAAVEAAEGAGLPLAAHASGVPAVARALEAGVSSVEHGFFLDRATLKRLAGQGVYWVPTCAAVKAHADDPEGRHTLELRRRLRAIYDGQLLTVAVAEALGVPLALGTDAGSYGLEHGAAVFMEMACWLAAGLRPDTVFRAATKGAARLMGLAGKVGSLALGAQAWLLGVPGDPAQDPLVMAQVKWRSF